MDPWLSQGYSYSTESFSVLSALSLWMMLQKTCYGNTLKRKRFLKGKLEKGKLQCDVPWTFMSKCQLLKNLVSSKMKQTCTTQTQA